MKKGIVKNRIVYSNRLNFVPYYNLANWFVSYIKKNFIYLSVRKKTLVYFKNKDIDCKLRTKLTQNFNICFSLEVDDVELYSIVVDENDYDGCAESFVSLLIELKKTLQNYNV